MKKTIIISLILVFFLSVYLFYQANKKEENVTKVIKEISKSKEIKFNIKTILFTTNKNVENHISSLKNTLFYNKDFIVTQGGIIKNEFINKYFNATEFKDITIHNENLIIGYKDGFLLLKEKYINHFIFNDIIKKCLVENDDFFCIKNKTIIKKNKDKFIEYYKSKDKISDILLNNNKLYILTSKSLVIKDKYREKIISILNANKLVYVNNTIFIISDREVFKIENNTILSVKKVSSITNLIFKNDTIYFISLNGVIYNDLLKKVHSLNNLVNNISYKNEEVYISTQNGIYKWSERIEKIDLNILNLGINENYITQITNYDEENLLISYFNSGIDIFNKKTIEIKTFIKNLNGVNDVFLKDGNIYIATTNGLYFYDDNLKYYGKKDGIIGTSISKIEWYKNKIFIGSEGGISQKTGELFTSIYGLHGLINNRVNCLKKVNDTLYVGTLGGVSILKGLKVIRNLKNKHFRAKWITAIEEINGIVYIGTYGGGIYVEENNDIREITNAKKRLFVNLNTFFNYKNKYLLAGTLKNGIWVYNIENNKSFFIKNLPSLNITAIKIIDDKVFIGSDFGFWHISIENILR